MDVYCENCGHRFEIPESMKGGMFNCPECSKLQSAGRHWHDTLWSGLYWGGVLVGCGLGITAFLNGHAPAGVAILITTGIIAAVAAVWG